MLMEAIKTAYSTAYYRLLLLAKSGRIGKVVSVDAACTRLEDEANVYPGQFNRSWGIITHYADEAKSYDAFSRVNFVYKDAMASIQVGKGIKSEGDLVVSGTEGYIYVPAPWWKTDYFEIRYENPANNKRYFYQLDGEGIRYEIVAFLKSIEDGRDNSYVDRHVSKAITGIMEDFYRKKDVREI